MFKFSLFKSTNICVFQFIKRFVHKNILKMDNAYVRYEDGSERFELFFHYKNQALGVDRQFNFQRHLTESIDSFLGRIQTNVEKVVNKKKNKKKRLEAGVSEEVKLDVDILLDSVSVDKTSSCKDVVLKNGGLKLKLWDHCFNIILNAPWIHKLKLPKSILAGFPVYPNKFETVFTVKEKSDFSWYKKLPKEKEWQKIGEGYVYNTRNEDINHILKLVCTPKNYESIGPEAEVESEVNVEAGPGYCPFETRHQFTKDKLAGKSFRVVSYNILADLYCDSDYTRSVLFPYCPAYALEIDYRKQLILKELIGYNADIICLQEVDLKIFESDLNPVFSVLGYEGRFNKKGGTVVEGLSCIFNASRFKLLKSDMIILGQELDKNPNFADLWEKVKSNKLFCDRVFPRSTGLQTTVLESKENDEILVVANIHLYFHPDADHIRLFQAGLAIRHVENVIQNLKEEHKNKRVSLVFCGDFNSVPECGIYRLFTTGSVPTDFPDWSSNTEEAIKDVSLTQSVQLQSACGTPEFTNYTVGFSGCLDYIFYQKDNIDVTQVIPLPSLSEITLHTALPSIVFPSDHIALISDLKWL